MRNIALITLFQLFLGGGVFAQVVKKDSALIRQIDTMFKNDQFWRREYMKKLKNQKPEYDEDTIQKRMEQTDSLNEVKAKAIIKRYGYPGYDLVGEYSNGFWAIVQHCDDDVPFQERVLALMKVQIAKNNASKENYAYLTDRVLVGKHQKQIYGSQVHIDPKTRKATPLPLKYPAAVNKLRRQMELGSLEKYLKSFE